MRRRIRATIVPHHARARVIFAASIGARHDPPAEVLAGALRERDAIADVVDGLAIAGPVAQRSIGASLESTAGNLACEAGAFLGTRVGPLRRAGSSVVEQLLRGRLETYLGTHAADVIVSTHPTTTELLGRLRHAGRLATPVVSAITDLAGLHRRAHPGIDLHLLAHPESEREVRAIAGADGQIAAVHGLTDLRLRKPPERSAARAELELPGRGSLVVVSGGQGVGDLRGATDTALHYGADAVVVLTGHDGRARARMQAAYAEDGRVQVWGVTDRMVTLLSAADVLIGSTAGLTVLEALSCDCRVISYGSAPVRTRINERAYERLGMATVAKNRPQLAHALIHALAAPPLGREAPDLPAAADLVLGLVEREPTHAR